ncbi:MAG TPA: hypothetical protein PKW50_05530 [Syntrophomonas sp.]|nr:hypothetical protein [Syntrophomonas sp.]
MKRRIIKIMAVIILIAVLVGGFWIYHVFAAIPSMFERNGQLQAEGYYTGEFEFKMLACANYLDHGHYLTAIKQLTAMQEQLETRHGLIKVPKFADKKAEMDFYLNLQNPRTGAFMDDSYPAVFYYEPTENIINHLEELAAETGQPIRLRYSLRFMEQFDTPEELTSCLDDLSRVGWIGAKLPKTTFVMTTQFISSSEYERLGSYSLAPGCKSALLKWFSANQDPVTGAWGPRDRNSGRLIKADVNCTYRVIKLFVDEQGKDKDISYSLQHRRELFATILKQAMLPMPADSSAAEIHDWNLCQSQGLKMLTRILWQNASPDQQEQARIMMSRLIINRFEKFYRPGEGAFAYYPDVKQASLDGTGTALSLLQNVGALSVPARDALWGTPDKTMQDTGEQKVSQISAKDLSIFTAVGQINSIRFYSIRPEQDFYKGISGIIYPEATPVLDAADLMPRVNKWLQETPQSMGNWTSREELLQQLKEREWPTAPVYFGDQGLEPVNKLLRENGQIVLVGLDELQVPRVVIMFKLVR